MLENQQIIIIIIIIWQCPYSLVLHDYMFAEIIICNCMTLTYRALRNFCGTGAEMFAVRVQAIDNFHILLNFWGCMWVFGVLKF